MFADFSGKASQTINIVLLSSTSSTAIKHNQFPAFSNSYLRELRGRA
jgi:hypothetical protein